MLFHVFIFSFNSLISLVDTIPLSENSIFTDSVAEWIEYESEREVGVSPKSNNFNCILCFWLNYFFLYIFMPLDVSLLIVRVCENVCNPIQKWNEMTHMATVRQRQNRGSNIISLKQGDK